jgi:transposase
MVQTRGEKKVDSPIKRASKTVFGALGLSGRVYWKKADRGNGSTFISFLRQLLQNNPGKRLAVIVDNASLHRCRRVKNFLQRYPMIKLCFLPTYSPEYNPIERFWGWLKKHLYGATSYASIEAVIKRVREIIWHYREDKLVSKIRFNFTSYQDLIND